MAQTTDNYFVMREELRGLLDSLESRLYGHIQALNKRLNDRVKEVDARLSRQETWLEATAKDVQQVRSGLVTCMDKLEVDDECPTSTSFDNHDHMADTCMKAAAVAFGKTVKQLKDRPKGMGDLVMARKMFQYWLSNRGMTMAAIAKVSNRADHTTMIHAVNHIRRLVALATMSDKAIIDLASQYKESK